MEKTTIYYQYEDGSVAHRVTTGGAKPATPEGATEISEEEYRAALAAIEDANRERAEERRAEEQARAKADYEALLAAGIPEETARRMSGYTGPSEAE